MNEAIPTSRRIGNGHRQSREYVAYLCTSATMSDVRWAYRAFFFNHKCKHVRLLVVWVIVIEENVYSSPCFPREKVKDLGVVPRGKYYCFHNEVFVVRGMFIIFPSREDDKAPFWANVCKWAIHFGQL